MATPEDYAAVTEALMKQATADVSQMLHPPFDSIAHRYITTDLIGRYAKIAVDALDEHRAGSG